MRALVGALVGLVVGAAIIGALDFSLAGKAFWAVMLAGLVAGVAMRVLAGGGSVSYAKGALAAVATALAAVGGPIAATQWISMAAAVKPLETDATVESADKDAEGQTSVEPLPEAPPVVSEATNPLSGVVAIRRPSADTSSIRDVACLVIGCLLAYQIGKGSEAKAVSEEPEANSEAPADPGEDAGGESGSEGDDGP